MHQAVEEAQPGARHDRQQRARPTEVMVIAVVGAKKRHDHRPDGQHAFDGQIDASH